MGFFRQEYLSGWPFPSPAGLPDPGIELKFLASWSMQPEHPLWGFPHSSVGKESAYSLGELGSIPGSGRSPGEGNGNPLQYTCLENPMDRGTCPCRWATVHVVSGVGHDLATKPPPFLHWQADSWPLSRLGSPCGIDNIGLIFTWKESASQWADYHTKGHKATEKA